MNSSTFSAAYSWRFAGKTPDWAFQIDDFGYVGRQTFCSVRNFASAPSLIFINQRELATRRWLPCRTPEGKCRQESAHLNYQRFRACLNGTTRKVIFFAG